MIAGADRARGSAPPRTLLFLFVLTAAAPAAHAVVAPPDPPSENCLGQPRPRLFLEQSLYGTFNPLGLEHQLRGGLCWPLVRKPGLLFSRTNVQAGAVLLDSPTQVLGGVFARLVPLSFLQLRGEVTGVFMWPIPLTGSGYLELPSYGAFSAAALDASSARSAGGVRAQLSALLLARVPLSRRLALVAASLLAGEWWRMGDAGYFYDVRSDVVLRASGDWFLWNHSLLALQIAVDERRALRVGAANELTFVPRSGYFADIVAGLVGFSAERVAPRVRSIELFVRAGAYAAHAFRTGGVNLLGGLSIDYDLSPAVSSTAK